MTPTPFLFTQLCGAVYYHDTQVQLENLSTIITTQRETIASLLDLLSPPDNTYSL